MSEIDTTPRRRSRRLLFGGLLAGTALAVAGGVAATILIVPGLEPPKPRRNGPFQLVAASEVLAHASEKARTEPEPDPKFGRYLYFESRTEQDFYMRVHDSRRPDENGKGTVHRSKSSSHTEVWYPVGGQRAGFHRGSGEVFQGPWPGKYTPEKSSSFGWFCKRHRDISEEARRSLDVEPDCKVGVDHYRADLPTEVDGMYKWLYDNSQGGNPPDVQAFHTIGETIYQTYLPPATRAALFAAAARIPGTTVTRDVVDLADRKGVAVGITWNDTRFELIFDAVTFEFFGERMIVDYDNVSPSPGAKTSGVGSRVPDPELARYQKPGHVLRQYVVLRVSPVDRAARNP